MATLYISQIASTLITEAFDIHGELCMPREILDLEGCDEPTQFAYIIGTLQSRPRTNAKDECMNLLAGKVLAQRPELDKLRAKTILDIEALLLKFNGFVPTRLYTKHDEIAYKVPNKFPMKAFQIECSDVIDAIFSFEEDLTQPKKLYDNTLLEILGNVLRLETPEIISQSIDKAVVLGFELGDYTTVNVATDVVNILVDMTLGNAAHRSLLVGYMLTNQFVQFYEVIETNSKIDVLLRQITEKK